MKKLTIICLAMLTCASIHAASWTWGSNGSVATIPNGTVALSGANIYLFFGYADSTSANSAKTALLASLRNGETISGYLSSSTLGADGTLSSISFDSDTGKKYAFAVILADDAEGNSYMYQTANKNATGVEVGDAALVFDISKTTLNGLDKTGTNAGWYQTAAAVPEPTSGLLVLLGMAGLALRRKFV